MVYSIIGTGNIAWLLATQLQAAGHTCAGIYSRNADAAHSLAEMVKTRAYSSIQDIQDNTDCCIIAVADHAIGEIASQLRFSNTTLIHTAGAVDTDILSSAAIHYGVLWPVYSIVKGNLPAHRNIPVVFEASTVHAGNLIQEVVHCFSDNPLMLENDKRKWLHLTAVISNNFTNHLFAVCEEICSENNIPFSALKPIIQQTTERLSHNSPAQLQTGPAKRGDNTIIAHHLDMLQQHPEWVQFYKAISASIEKMYNH